MRYNKGWSKRNSRIYQRELNPREAIEAVYTDMQRLIKIVERQAKTFKKAQQREKVKARKEQRETKNVWEDKAEYLYRRVLDEVNKINPNKGFEYDYIPSGKLAYEKATDSQIRSVRRALQRYAEQKVATYADALRRDKDVDDTLYRRYGVNLSDFTEEERRRFWRRFDSASTYSDLASDRVLVQMYEEVTGRTAESEYVREQDKEHFTGWMRSAADDIPFVPPKGGQKVSIKNFDW